jgi:alkylmercury lyase
MTDLTSEVRAAAFHLLLETGEPVRAAALADELGCNTSEVAKAIEQLEGQGLIRRDEAGSIVGSYGLSVVPSQDQIRVQGRQFWTWCAKTSLGVVGALGGGTVISRCPVSSRQLLLTFQGSKPPRDTELAVFWPSTEFTSCCKSTVEEVCPNINFFESAAAAQSWAASSGVPGEVLSVEEATARSVGRWAELLAARKSSSLSHQA